MSSRDEAFQPESIDEHVQQLKQAASQLDEMSTPNARLIQDLRLAHVDDAQSGQRVWERLAARMGEQNTQANQLRLLTNEPTATERSAYMQTEQSEIGPMPAIQAGKPPRKFKRMFTLVAALLVAMLLIGSILVIVTNMHPYGGTAAAPSPTPTPTATANTASGIPFPTSDCPKSPGADDPTWETWDVLCRAGKFVSINQSQTLTTPSRYSYTETIEAAYADRNMLFLFYDFSPVKATDIVQGSNMLTTKQGLQLRELDGGRGYFVKNQHFTQIVGYDTSNLPANLQTLTLKVNSIINVEPTTAKGYPLDKTSFDFFNVPVNAGQILTPNQTITANGVPITLAKVVIAASGVHLVFSASHIPDAALSSGFTATLAGNANASHPSYSLLTQKGSMVATGFELIFASNLSWEHGAWTLTVKAAEPQPWVFHFTVPA